MGIKLSLCMIARNEEKYLPRCLESVRGVVDEIILVDTGSTDRTREVAAQYGARVYDFQWVDDFSAARNASIEKASGDWILWLDADEYLDPRTAGQVRETLELVTTDGVRVIIDNLMDDGNRVTTLSTIRFIRNHRGIRFIRPIHEGPMLPDGPLIQTDSTIRVIHLGYLYRVVREKDKHNRNLRLLKRDLGDAFTHFNLANEYVMHEEWEKGLAMSRKALSGAGDIFVRAAMTLNIITCLRALGRYEEALRAVEEAKVQFPGYTDLLLSEGMIKKDQGRWDDAIDAFNASVRCGESSTTYFRTRGTGSFMPLALIGEIEEARKNYSAAVEAYAKSLRENKAQQVVLQRLTGLLARREDPEKALAFIEGLYDSDNPGDLKLLLENAIFHRKAGQARKYWCCLVKESMPANGPEIEAVLALYAGQGDATLAYRSILDAPGSPSSDLLIHALSAAVIFEDRELLRLVVGKASNATGRLAEAYLRLLGGRRVRNLSEYKDYLKILEFLIQLEQFEAFERFLALRQGFRKSLRREIGDLYLSYGFTDLALEEYMGAIAEHSYDHVVYRKLGEICLERAMDSEAIDFFLKACKMKPDDYISCYHLITLYRRQGNPEAASIVLREALKHYPDSKWLADQARELGGVGN